ncbi:IS481 family transposase [Salinibacterium sp. SYSU T00001]|uniref:IS481 family transposase n=1 Tax=Homoserinimonas sedimenticola TaxID=2986805 RepID=UPI002235BC3A|nr:IS481 family transposase [Salinibacterium sedimenticola]MCW4385893.1 IS481 family transposase [Salinibacterium sedimenticola]
MSKARLVLTALFIDQQSPAEVAARYGVHRSWVYRLKARYEAEGEAAFQPRSRRPKTSPTGTSTKTVELIIRLRRELGGTGHDAGPDTIAWHLRHHHRITVSPATISRHLSRAGLVTPQPKKRPRSSYIRFEADLPNETWQSDFTHYRLSTGTDVEILTWLDDHSRYALSITAHRPVTAGIVATVFRSTATTYGIPASTLTDNGMVFTTRFAGRGRQGGRNALENELRRLHVTQKNSRPGHPTTCGKVERFQQTLKNWLRAQHSQPSTPAELHHLLDQFRTYYNQHRPHRSLPHHATPAATYAARPKALPQQRRDNDTHDRIRHDRVDTSGTVTLRHNSKLHRIGVGRPHAGTHVILLIQDLDIRIVNPITGEVLRQLTLDPSRDYQPRNPTNPRNDKRPNPHNGFDLSPIS